MNLSRVRRELSGVLPTSQRLLYRPFSPPCRGRPSADLGCRFRELELEKFFAELSFYCGQCCERISQQRQRMRDREERVAALDAKLRAKEDSIAAAEDEAMRRACDAKCGSNDRLSELISYRNALSSHFAELLGEINKQACVLDNSLRAAETIAIVERLLACPQAPEQLQLKADIPLSQVYDDRFSSVLAGRHVLLAARSLAAFQNLDPGGNVDHFYPCFLRPSFRPLRCQLVDRERVERLFAAAREAGIAGKPPLLFQLDACFLTEAEPLQRYPFERCSIADADVDEGIARAISTLRKALRQPRLSVTVQQCLQSIERMADKFEDASSADACRGALLRYQTDFGDDDPGHAREEATLRAQYEKLKHSTASARQWWAANERLQPEPQQLSRLEACCEQLSDSVQALGKRFGCNCPAGTLQLTERMIRQIDDLVSDLLAEYLSFDRNVRRRSRIRWVEEMKQREIKQQLISLAGNGTAAAGGRQRTKPRRQVMSRSYDYEKRQTQLDVQRTAVQREQEVQIQQGGLFFQ